MRPSTPQPCFICRRRDHGLAVAKGEALRWYCADCGTDLALRANAMSLREFDIAEQRAMQAAGEKAGAYLDSIGKTDIETMAPEEWAAFCVAMIREFGAAMRREIREHKAPF